MNVNFQQLFLVVKMTESEEWTYFNLLFMYFITVNKYRFCISVIGYINMQIIGIGYKKNQYLSITIFIPNLHNCIVFCAESHIKQCPMVVYVTNKT